MCPEQDRTRQLQTSGEEFRGSCPAWAPTMPCSDPFLQSALVKPSIPCPPLKKRTAKDKHRRGDSQAGKTPHAPAVHRSLGKV